MSTLYRTYGARGLWLRAAHEARIASGRFRAAPHHRVQSGPGPLSAFAVDAELLRAATDGSRALARAHEVSGGRYQAYRRDWRPLPADPNQWLRQPTTQRLASAKGPWWETSHLDPDFGDIKDLWEPARFAWVYDLVRGWLLTGDDSFAATFHAHFAAWADSSPPFRGPHWSCGQETWIRSAALLYAEANLGGASASTPTAMRRVRDVLAAAGERIMDALGYAISQRNNHAISEATGLVVLGLRFRGQHPDAQRWLERGLRWLQTLVREQFSSDGWYIQHSFNYTRLALDQLVLAERALRSAGLSLGAVTAERVRASAELLLATMDGRSGTVPNHGANDGAFIHPVTLAEYRDFRPILTAVSVLWDVPLPADIHPDMETAAWLGARVVPRRPARVDGVHSGASGWAVARVGGTAVFLRAGRYASRPGHLDALHLDIWMDGREVVVDPGTYAYNAPPPWNNALIAARVHNGPMVDGEEPGIRGPRFLWFAWPSASLRSTEWHGDRAVLVAELVGKVRRTVTVTPGRVRVEDQALDPAARELTALWTLHPDVSPAMVQVEGGRSIGRGEEGSVRGWFSPKYGERLPTAYVEAGGSGASTIVTTLSGPGNR